jgi:hypothetical protein
MPRLGRHRLGAAIGASIAGLVLLGIAFAEPTAAPVAIVGLLVLLAIGLLALQGRRWVLGVKRKLDDLQGRVDQLSDELAAGRGEGSSHHSSEVLAALRSLEARLGAVEVATVEEREAMARYLDATRFRLERLLVAARGDADLGPDGRTNAERQR